MLITILFKERFNAIKNYHLVDLCDTRLNELKKIIILDSSLKSHEKNEIVSYFLSGRDLTKHLEEFLLPFWNYGLGEETNN